MSALKSPPTSKLISLSNQTRSVLSECRTSCSISSASSQRLSLLLQNVLAVLCLPLLLQPSARLQLKVVCFSFSSYRFKLLGLSLSSLRSSSCSFQSYLSCLYSSSLSYVWSRRFCTFSSRLRSSAIVSNLFKRLVSSVVKVRRGLASSIRSCSNFQKLLLGFLCLSYHSLIH